MKFSRKTILSIGFVGVSLLSILYLVFRTKTPTSTPTSSSSDSQIESKINISLPEVQLGQSVLFPTVPTQMTVYRPTVTEVNLTTVAGKIASELDLSKKTNGTFTYWTSTDGFKNLTIDDRNKIVNYKISFTPTNSYYKQAPTQTLEKLAGTAKTFITSIGIDPSNNLVPDLNQVSYFRVADEHFVTTKASQANVIAIPFNYQLDQVNVFSGNQNRPSITVYFGSNNLIVQIVAYTTSLYTFEKTTDQPTKSFDDVKNDLKQGNFQALNVYTDQPQITDPKSYSNLLIESISLEYRVNATKTQVLPYFRLNGSQNETQISLVIPALKS